MSLSAPKLSTDRASCAPYAQQTPTEHTEHHHPKLARKHKIQTYFVLSFTIEGKLVRRFPSGYFVDLEPVHSGLRRKMVKILSVGQAVVMATVEKCSTHF